MQDILQFAWKRFTLISTIIGEAQGRFITSAFYFSILVPFGIGSRLFTDPLQRKGTPQWHDRTPVPTDLDSAQQQG
ncbi:MAG: hypothetical protein MUF87_11165 [Anaerolineae bacterium]|nr:hypothetical protein [Anaerolineae bacterium]